MKWRTLTCLILLALATFFDEVANAEMIAYSQPPVSVGGSSVLSFRSGQQIADDWVVNSAATIVGLNWWGTYNSATIFIPPSDDIRIRVYDTNSGLPDNIIQDYSIGNDVSRTATGSFDQFGRPLFAYHASFAGGGFTRALNERIYFSVISDSGDHFAWTEGTGGNGVMFRGPSWEQTIRDRAFEVEVAAVPEPSSLLLTLTGALGMVHVRRRKRRQAARRTGVRAS